jgi:hypothetical protein
MADAALVTSRQVLGLGAATPSVAAEPLAPLAPAREVQ